MTYQEFVSFTSGTCTHSCRLAPSHYGIYNGLAGWGKVYQCRNGIDPYDGLDEVQSIWTEWIDDEDGGYRPTFTPSVFGEYGWDFRE